MNFELSQLDLRYAGLRVLDPGRVARIAASLAREGQQTPVLVVGDAVLVDGFHRLAALRLLGEDIVLGLSLDMNEDEALVLAWRLETSRRRSALEDGWLLDVLIQRHGCQQSELAAKLQRTRSWVSQRLALVRVLPQSVQAAVRDARVPAQAAMKSLVPMARQDVGACARLVAALPTPVTVRQLQRVVGAWKKADSAGRARIEAHPELLLKTEEALSVVSPDDEERLASDFEGLAGLCRRARRAVKGGLFARANSPLLQHTWRQAHEAFEALDEEVQHARSAHTRRHLEAEP